MLVTQNRKQLILCFMGRLWTRVCILVISSVYKDLLIPQCGSAWPNQMILVWRMLWIAVEIAGSGKTLHITQLRIIIGPIVNQARENYVPGLFGLGYHTIQQQVYCTAWAAHIPASRGHASAKNLKSQQHYRGNVRSAFWNTQTAVIWWQLNEGAMHHVYTLVKTVGDSLPLLPLHTNIIPLLKCK